jgi:hypothetical protein
VETCLVDTSYLLARSLPTDPLHDLALEWEHRTEVGVQFITTDLILIEFLDGLSRGSVAIRTVGSTIARAIRKSSQVEVVPLTADLFEAALRLYELGKDKDWGMTDCVSFALMRKRRIRNALTYDHHFVQAGFRALLRGD